MAVLCWAIIDGGYLDLRLYIVRKYKELAETQSRDEQGHRIDSCDAGFTGMAIQYAGVRGR